MKQSKIFALPIFLSLFSISLFANNEYPTPIDIVKTYFTAVDAGNSTEVEKLLTDNFQANAPFSPQALPKQAWLGVGQGFKAAFPDMKHDILQYIESGSTVVVKGVFKGKNDGPMMGNPATGNNVSLPFTSIFEFDKSWKIKSLDIQFDQKSMEAQLMAGLPNPVAGAEATVRGIMAAADAGYGEKVVSFFAADAKHYFSGQLNTNEELKMRVAAFKAGFPDIKRSLDEIIVQGNTVTIRGWLTGTNTGVFMGAPATNNQIKVSVLGEYKLNSAGKVTEAWVELDRATVQMQLTDGSVAKGK
ncbi:MAG: ester cyclase [Phycisphaerae bacterium]|nr:ester cyclase [Saprospiraceae bacterium]